MENLDKEKWHEALLAGRTVEDIANNIMKGEPSEWVQFVLDNTSRGDKVLELGSGTGEISAHLALAGRKVYMQDFSSTSLVINKQLFQELNLSYEKMQCANVLRESSWMDNSFDCVFSSGLLEHFNNDDIFFIMKESSRITRDKIITIVPNSMSVPYMLGKYLQEKLGTWKWGKEEAKASMKYFFLMANMKVTKEITLAKDHALNFLPAPIQNIFQNWYNDINATIPKNQGYLLATVGELT